VLGVTALSDRTGGYYLADLAVELGPLRDGVAGPAGPGHWTGAGAQGLGLVGRVDGDDLARVLSGIGPSTGRPLAVRRPRVSAFDLTFSAPKSVSVLVALGPPEVAAVILGAHQDAVGGALGYVADHAAAVRRRAGSERQVLGVRGVVGAVFTHGLSRALDPHLHTHVLVANVAQGSDGRWSALDGRGLFAHRRAAGALYEAQLRGALTTALGVRWSVRGAAYEVAGLEPLVLGGFSQRRAEIREHLAARPTRSGRAGRVAWAATRDPKAGAVTRAQVARLWAARAGALGTGPGDLGAVLGRPVPVDRSVDEHRFGAVLATLGGGAPTRRDVVAAWAGALGVGVGAEAVEGCVDQLVSPGGAGVAEPGFAPATVSAPPGALRALGARPGSPGPLARWQRAARALEAYRGRWGEFTPPGATRPAELEQMPAARLAEHLAVAREVRAARLSLGRAQSGAEREGPGLGRR